MSKLNKDLQAKFNAAMSALIALGEEAGCSVPAGGELSDSELEAVAGGKGRGGSHGYGASSSSGSGSRSGYGSSSGSFGGSRS